MFVSASRSRRAGLAGLAVCSVLVASTFAANAGASIVPAPVPPPPTDAVLVKPTDLVISATTSTTIRVKNTGDRSAGPFSIGVEKGFMADQCGGGWSIPPVRRDVSGLAGGQAKTVTVPESSDDRHVTVDYLNAVAESNEFNNTETVPGGATIVC
jgi:hypothetical protein